MAMRRSKNKKGFTLVELSLSIAFIGILSITVALIINDAIAAYRRGLTLNQINTVGMDLVDDIRTAVQNSPAKDIEDVCKNGPNSEEISKCKRSFGYTAEKKSAKVNGRDGVPIYGVFCTGSYSYIWNSGYLFSDDASIDGGGGINLKGVEMTRLLKVEDTKKSVCRAAVNMSSNGGEIEAEGTKDSAMLLSDDSANSLALYDFDVAAPVFNGQNAAFYSMSFILGTVKGGINIMSSGNFCKAPESNDAAENFDYCAINKFNFAAQANGRKK